MATPALPGNAPLLLATTLLFLNFSPLNSATNPPSFPTGGILPKEEIAALRFLAQYPDYDGRGVVVAVFDTGVDPGAPGLQTTADGRAKIVDVVDATGGGDVDTSAVAEIREGHLAGLSGRRLQPGAHWKNPTGKYHLGLKRGYELFPEPLVQRLKTKRRERWDEGQRQLEARLQQALIDWDTAHRQPSENETRQRTDLQLRLDQLRSLQKSWDDPGPIFDCVVFHEGDRWRAVVDTDEDGNLGEEKLLTNYRDERQHGTFGPEALLNFAVNILEDGKLLSIVVESGTHGTHVAGIVAACFPDQPELNGVAPGAQIVSVKIGDTRLGGMETATGFVRGLAAVRTSHCDVINLSYGEASAIPDRGRIPQLVSEIVNEDGVIFIASAGNEGPALSTASAPGATTSALIGVGAYVSPAMMTNAYSMREGPPENQYTFSSRGPTTDGAWGVCISAPGGAISPVPNWTLQRNQLMNGTSMAAPNAAGGVALLLSGLKAAQIPYSPTSIRRALENSARMIEGLDPFSQGRGLLQVDRAFELCKTLAATSLIQPRLEVGLGRGQRGVYLREPEESMRPIETSVRINPVYPEKTDNRQKVDFERRYRLEATAPWIQAPTHLLLAHGGKSFDLRIDPTHLAPGVHAAELLGYEVDITDAGPAFRIPITVVRPEKPTAESPEHWHCELALAPAKLERRFLRVPDGATWAELTVRSGELDGQRRLVVHALQLLPGRSFASGDLRRYVGLARHTEETLRFPVTGGRTLELCLGQLWSSLGQGTFKFELAFQGIQPASTDLTLEAGALVTRVDATASVRDAQLAPRAELRTRRRTLSPSQTDLRPLANPRDALTEGRVIHELILNYRFNLDEPAAVLPRFPALNGRLYEGEFESQLYMILDANKQVRTVDDAWEPAPVRLEKGDYTLRFHVRHDRTDWLEKLKSLPLQLDQDLPNPLPLDAYPTPDAALTGGPKLGARPLRLGERTSFFLSAPSRDAVAKVAKPGDVLAGTLRLETVDGTPAFPLTLVPAPAPAADKAKTPEAPKDDRPLDVRLAEERRDLAVSQLDRLTGEKDAKAFDRLARDLRKQFPNHYPVLVKQLHRVDGNDRDQHLRSVVAAADEVIKQIDTTQLAQSLGIRADPDNPAALRLQRDHEQEKEALLDALYRKGRALAWMELPDDDDTPGSDAPAANASTMKPKSEPPFDPQTVERLFEANFAELRQWTDTTASPYALLHIRREWRQGRLGEVLKLLQQQITRDPTDLRLHRKRIQIFRDLGWENWADHEQQWLPVRFPKSYPGF